MPVGQDGILTWLLLSEGAGFRGGTAAIEVSGPEGLAFSTGIVNGAKFHNGQIVGGYELPANAPAGPPRPISTASALCRRQSTAHRPARRIIAPNTPSFTCRR